MPSTDRNDLGNLVSALNRRQSLFENETGARAAALDGCIRALDETSEELAATIVAEVGKLPGEAQAEVRYARSFFTWARDALGRYSFETTLEPGRHIHEQAAGIALLIAPFNDPLAGLARKMAPALAAGCCALVKPSSLGALTASIFAQALEKAGVGDEIRFLFSSDGETIGRLIDDPHVGIVSFTGSTTTGLKVAARTAAGGKPVIAELGGNNPFVILGDADLDLAISDLISRKTRAAGQACSSVNRVFVSREIYDTTCDRIVEACKSSWAGPSDRSAVTMGPVRTPAARQELVALKAAAIENGGRLLAEGRLVDCDHAECLYPFSVIETSGPSPFDTRESFGPLLAIQPYDDLSALIQSLGRESHQLAAYFYTGDPEGLQPRLRPLKYGSIGINSTAIQGPHVPTGGQRGSGIGREGGLWGFRAFLRPVNLFRSGAST